MLRVAQSSRLFAAIPIRPYTTEYLDPRSQGFCPKSAGEGGPERAVTLRQAPRPLRDPQTGRLSGNRTYDQRG